MDKFTDKQKGSHSPDSPTISLESPDILQAIDMVVNSLDSSHSRRVYSTALFEFLEWYDGSGKPGLSRALLQSYRQKLLSKGLSSSTINLKLCAIRKLLSEMGEANMFDPLLLSSIAGVKGVKTAGTRSGNWLSRKQAEDLINAPDLGTLKGIRDRAILAVLIGCGLRRTEVSRLCLQHIQQREGRWAIVDLVGKGNRVRSVPMPPWTKVALDLWTLNLKAITGSIAPDQPLFRAINKSDVLAGARKATNYLHSDGFISDQAIADVVRYYSKQLGYSEVAAHDLRRTFAKLARKGGAEIDQIQLSLGHASVKTTERYLGTEQNFFDAPADRIEIQLAQPPSPTPRKRRGTSQ